MLSNLMFITPILLIASSLLMYFLEQDSNIIWFFVFLCNFIYLFRFVKIVPLFIIFLFMVSYTFEPYNFFTKGLFISYWTSYQNAHDLNKAIIMNGIFLVIFGSVLFNVSEKKIIEINSFCRKNNFARNLFLVCFITFTHFSLSGDTILVSGYGNNDVVKSPIFEYSLVFLVLSLSYSEINKKTTMLFGVAITFFCLKSLLYGGRIEVLQCLFIYTYFVTNFFRKWSLKKLYVCISIGFIFMTIIGSLRSDPEKIKNLIYSPISVFEPNEIRHGDTISSNYGDILQASSRMIGLKDDEVWDFQFRTVSFLSYMFNIFLYGTEYKDYSNLALKSQSEFGTGGGGYISAYFYVWLGWLGVVLSSFIISVILKDSITKSSNSEFMKMYGFMILVTFPRWFGYSPISLVKFCLIAALLYKLSRVFFRIFKRN